MKNWRQEHGGKRDDTCDHGLSRSWKLYVHPRPPPPYVSRVGNAMAEIRTHPFVSKQSRQYQVNVTLRAVGARYLYETIQMHKITQNFIGIKTVSRAALDNSHAVRCCYQVNITLRTVGSPGEYYCEQLVVGTRYYL